MEKRLYRSRTDRMIFGVCGGLAKYFGMDPSLMRIIFVLVTLATAGAGILAYLVMAIIVPVEGSEKTEPKEVVVENAADIKTTAEQFGKKMEETFGRQKPGSDEEARAHARRRQFLGILVVVVGAVLLMSTLGWFHWSWWAYGWPVILIAIGLIIIFGVSRRK